MNCTVFKSLRKADTYVYLPEQGKIEELPEALLTRLDPFEKVMQLELTAERKLAITTGKQVMDNIARQGFHLQLPDDRDIDAIMAAIAAATLNK